MKVLDLTLDSPLQRMTLMLEDCLPAWLIYTSSLLTVHMSRVQKILSSIGKSIYCFLQYPKLCCLPITHYSCLTSYDQYTGWISTKGSKLSKKTHHDFSLANCNLNPPNSQNSFTLVSMFFPRFAFTRIDSNSKNWFTRTDVDVSSSILFYSQSPFIYLDLFVILS